jgi:asparagine synthase (glutamine-hydrolysing)
MAARVGARHVVVTARHEDLLEELPAAVADGEGLAINAHLPAKRLLAHAIRDAGFKVVLTGEGADEVLAGYAHLRCDLDEAQSAIVARDNTVSAGLMLPDGDTLDTSSVARRLDFVPTWLRAKASLGRRVHALLRDDWLAGFAGRDPFEVMLDGMDETQLRGRGRVEQASYLWSKLALEGYILRTLGDGMEMAASVEGRLPFLDHRLFELVRTFPTSLKIAAGVEKAVLREAIGPLVTERLRARQKHPFLAPPLLATERGAPPFVVDRLLGAELPPFFERAKVRAFLDRIPAMTLEERNAAEPALMLVTTAALLHAHYRL